MTIRFRIDAVILDTVEGPVTYNFPSALTVLAGPVGVGKTTLFELFKYGLGGKAELAPVAVENVRDVEVHLTVGDERLALTRSLDTAKHNTVRVVDLITHDRLPDRFVNRDPLLSTLLLEALGLPTDMRAAARSRTATNVGNRISFADIFGYMYVRQGDINRDIASSQESVREPKRKSVFELLFGITDAAILKTHSDIAQLNSDLIKAEQDHEIVLQFLRESNTTNRIDAEIAYAAAEDTEATAEARLAYLRESLNPIEDRETHALRDLLNEAERSAAEARQAATVLAQQQVDYSKERRRLAQELDRLGRLQDAGQRLADFEFKICPRCLQDLHHRQTEPGLCRLCLQPDPVDLDTVSTYESSYEQRQLTDQLDELDEQLTISAEQLIEAQQAIEHRQALIIHLSADLSVRTRERITPQLQAFNDATRKLVEARSTQEALEGVLRQWDRADDLGLAADRIRTDIERSRTSLQRAEHALAERNDEIFDEVDAEFDATASAIGIPGVERARIDRKNYLPLLNEQSFKKFSPSGGGIRTATQVAYWLTLVTVALRRHDTEYPAFLLIDGPRTSLNDDQLSDALYRRIVTQVDAASGQLQIILGDRELPSAYRRDYQQIDFSYENPTIGTVPHPGPAAVKPISLPAVEDV
jgi:hypothetical protein